MSTETVVQTTSTRRNRHFQKRDIGGALVLISVGILLLLNTTGVVGWGIWAHIFLSFLRLWPLYLLLAGMSIILGSSGWAKTLLGIVSWMVFLIIIGFALLSYTNQSFSWDSIWTNLHINLGYNANTETKEITITRNNYPTATSRNIDLNLVAGKFTVAEGNSSELLDLKSSFPESQGVPSLETSLVGHQLNVVFQQTYAQNWLLFTKSPEYNFTLGAPQVPTAFNIQMTAGEGNITLANTEISSFIAKMTAGNLTVDLTNAALPSTFSLEITAGNLEVSLPKDTAATVNYELTAGNLSIAGQNMKWGNNQYIYNATGTHQVILNLKVTAGNLDIKFK